MGEFKEISGARDPFFHIGPSCRLDGRATCRRGPLRSGSGWRPGSPRTAAVAAATRHPALRAASVLRLVIPGGRRAGSPNRRVQAVGSVRSPAALGAWLAKVVARLCALPALMLMRSVEELKTVEDSVRFAHMPPDQLRMDLSRALAALPGHYRQIILLRDLEALTIAEISQRLSMSVESVKSLLRRARAAARQQLIGTTS